MAAVDGAASCSTDKLDSRIAIDDVGDRGSPVLPVATEERGVWYDNVGPGSTVVYSGGVKYVRQREHTPSPLGAPCHAHRTGPSADDFATQPPKSSSDTHTLASCCRYRTSINVKSMHFQPPTTVPVTSQLVDALAAPDTEFDGPSTQPAVGALYFSTAIVIIAAALVSDG